MNLLSFIGTPSGIEVRAWPELVLYASPILIGVFASAFWTAAAVVVFRRGALARHLRLLSAYCVGATLFNAYTVRFHDMPVSAPVIYATALFAGSALAVNLVFPVIAFLSRPHTVFRNTGGAIVVGIPFFLLPLIFAARHPLAGTFLLGSAAMGFWTILCFINIGLSSIAPLPGRATVILGVLFVVPEYLFLSTLPSALQWM